MTQKNQVYKCSVCGNMVEVLHTGVGELVCCDKPMILMEEKVKEAEGQEKHLPVVTISGNSYQVDIGSVAHPMEENHYIEWVEVITSNAVYKRFLNPEDAPQVTFNVSGDVLQTKAYCNIHGLWVSA